MFVNPIAFAAKAAPKTSKKTSPGAMVPLPDKTMLFQHAWPRQLHDGPVEKPVERVIKIGEHPFVINGGVLRFYKEHPARRKELAAAIMSANRQALKDLGLR